MQAKKILLIISIILLSINKGFTIDGSGILPLPKEKVTLQQDSSEKKVYTNEKTYRKRKLRTGFSSCGLDFDYKIANRLYAITSINSYYNSDFEENFINFGFETGFSWAFINNNYFQFSIMSTYAMQFYPNGVNARSEWDYYNNYGGGYYSEYDYFVSKITLIGLDINIRLNTRCTIFLQQDILNFNNISYAPYLDFFPLGNRSSVLYKSNKFGLRVYF